MAKEKNGGRVVPNTVGPDVKSSGSGKGGWMGQRKSNWYNDLGDSEGDADSGSGPNEYAKKIGGFAKGGTGMAKEKSNWYNDLGSDGEASSGSGKDEYGAGAHIEGFGGGSKPLGHCDSSFYNDLGKGGERGARSGSGTGRAHGVEGFGEGEKNGFV